MRKRVRSLNTDDYELSDRVQIWRSHVDSVVFVANYSVFGRSGLHAEHRSVAIERFGLFYFLLGAHAVERTADLVEQHPKQSIFLSLILEGLAVHYTADGVRILGPGEFLVYDPDQPYLMAFTEHTRQYFLDVPRDVLRKHGLAPTIREPHKYDHFEQARSGVAASDVARLFNILDEPDADVSDLESRIVATLLRLEVASTSTGTSHRYLDAANRVIHKRLSDPDLTVARIASEVGVSVRHLSREFRLVGNSPLRALKNARLDAAKLLLAGSSLSISQIAQDCGFSSSSSFARTFAAVIGTSPRTFRRSAVALCPGEEPTATKVLA